MGWVYLIYISFVVGYVKMKEFLYRKPSSRFEVLQLKKALDDMLEKAGVHDEIDQLTAPTQVTLSRQVTLVT